MDVVDPVGELAREGGGVEELVLEVARVEVDPEGLVVADRVEGLARRDEVVGDLGRVHLEPEAHPLRFEDVHDRPEALGEVLVAALDLGEVVRREGVELVPDRRAREAVHLRDAERGRGAGRVLQALGGALPDALGLAVAPDLGRKDRLVARVDRVADGLPDEVRAERPAAEPVALEELAPSLRVPVVGERLVDLEVVAPAGELEPVEPPLARLGGEVVDGQVGPLAGEERYGTRHRSREYRACERLEVLRNRRGR